MFFGSSVLKVLPLFKAFMGKTFAKSMKTAMLFSRIALLLMVLIKGIVQFQPQI